MNRRFYITLNGSLSRRSNTIKFDLKGQRRTIFIPVEQLDEIYVLAEVDFNRKLISFLGGKEVLIHFFSYGGAYVGSFIPKKGKGGSEVLVKEIAIYLNWNRRMEFARSFVKGAIRNMIFLLSQRRIDEGVSLLKEKLKNIDSIKAYKRLLFEEGKAWEIYYKHWNSILKDASFKFVYRRRRPPSDPINALISFGNSLLYSFVLNELYRTGLDPRIGFLHSVKKRRFGLNLDMAEIFKPLIVDRLIFKLINRGQIKPSDFRKGKDGGVYLNRKGRKTFIEAFERQLRSKVKLEKGDIKITYYGLVKRECQRLKKAIMEDGVYSPMELGEL